MHNGQRGKSVSSVFALAIGSINISSLQQFNKLKQKFTAIELENRDDCADIQAVLGELTGATSVRFLSIGRRVDDVEDGNVI